MVTLLHIDSSAFPAAASTSRSVTDTFRKAWEEQHPQGTVIYRDLTANQSREDEATGNERPLAAVRHYLDAEPIVDGTYQVHELLVHDLRRADLVVQNALVHDARQERGRRVLPG